MSRRFVARRNSLRIVLTLSICSALLLIPCAPFVVRGEAWAAIQGQSPSPSRAGRARPGKPEVTLPNLDMVRTGPEVMREAQPPIPSTIRSRQNPLVPRNGRRVGDPFPTAGEDANGDSPSVSEGGFAAVASSRVAGPFTTRLRSSGGANRRTR